MFTQQAQNLIAGLVQMGMPVEQATMFGQVLGNCAQELEHNGPVIFNGPVTFGEFGVPATNGKGGGSLTSNVPTNLNGATTIDGNTVLNGNTTIGGPVTVTNQQNIINIFNSITDFTLIDLFITNLVAYLISSGRFVQVSPVMASRYYSTTHTFQEETRPMYVLQPGSNNAFADWSNSSSQPVGVSHVTDVSWSSPTLSETKTQANCYVLETGTTATTTVDTATAC